MAAQDTITEQTLKHSSDAADAFQSIAKYHPVTQEFCQRSPNIRESRSVLIIEPEHLPYSLLGTTLACPDAIAKPYVLLDDDAGSLLAFYRLGRKLAGHVGIVHGGIAGVILDECMGRACFPRLPGKIAVTAKLELSYLSPIPVDSVIMVQANTTEIQGRKAWVEAKISDAREGRELVKATALYIQPKWASDMSQVV